ncbi:MAG: radical SAM protein [Candidatus Aminicenantes bacterium]|nr:radical SAM protein [Candidatus Aminicenantes bacterium]
MSMNPKHLPHLHTFNVWGEQFVLNIPGSRVYKINQRMMRVIELLQEGQPAEQITLDMGTRFPVEEIAGDLSMLEKLGLLTAEEKTFNPTETQFPDTLDMQISHHCNLACRYCYARGGNFGGQDKLMSLETAQKTVDYFIDHTDNKKELCINYDGGEPLINFKVIKEATLYARDKGEKKGKHIRFNIGTNATLVTDEIADFFSRLKFSPQVSLDGAEAIQDELRPYKNRKGAYQDMMEGIEKLKKKGVEFASRITITPRNLNLKDNVELLHRLGVIRIAAFPATGIPGEYAFRPQHLQTLKEEYDKTAEFFLDSLFNKGELVCFSNFTDNLRNLHNAKVLHYGCGAARSFISVDPHEDIYPCHRLVGNEKYRLGNLQSGMDDEKRRIFLDNHVASKEKCRRCWAKYLCGGGCLVEAEYVNGDIKNPYDVSCEIYKYEKELSIMIYAKILARDKSLLNEVI